MAACKSTVNEVILTTTHMCCVLQGTIDRSELRDGNNRYRPPVNAFGRLLYLHAKRATVRAQEQGRIEDLPDIPNCS